MDDLQALLAASAARHSHLCPRQVLGVRAGLAGLAALCLIPQQKDKHLLVVVETDGCFTDGIEVTTGVAIGHRTLRIEDYGKIAATFVKIPSGETVRISPRPDIRQRAWDYAPSEKKYYYAQLHAYQVMPEAELFNIKEVELAIPLEKIISRAGVRTECDFCGEDIINERQVHRDGFTLCRACAGPAMAN
jgi:formylmethanofuran dehydrogenase subunit E